MDEAGVAGRLRGLAAFGQALWAYHQGDTEAQLGVRWDLGEETQLPVSVFFSPPDVGSPVEKEALARARGTVLDVGAGSGRFSAAVSERGLPVTALELLPDAVRVLRARGLRVVEGDLMAPGIAPPADTVLVMMNGASHAGTMAGLPGLLAALCALTLPDGRILIDSTDPAHPAVEWEDPQDGRHPGELHLQLGFGGAWGPLIPQLFVGPEALSDVAGSVGLECEVAAADDDGRYLAELRVSRRLDPQAGL